MRKLVACPFRGPRSFSSAKPTASPTLNHQRTLLDDELDAITGGSLISTIEGPPRYKIGHYTKYCGIDLELWSQQVAAVADAVEARHAVIIAAHGLTVDDAGARTRLHDQA